jgi:glyoxylase-like metal-dependent hydrolase (beta-lactamase superfamily II)
MRIEETGPVVDGVFMVGHPGVPIYLLDIGRPVIVEAGMAFMAALYAADVKRIVGNRTPAALMLTHSHFDHCGAVAFLKERFPEMQVAASEKARSVFARPNALQLMRELSDAAARMAIEMGLPQRECPAFAPFAVDRVVGDGDSIALGDNVSLAVIATPGHTRDSVSYYIPEKKILFASEAVGLPDQTGYIYIDCLVDFDLYTQSHRKLAALDIDTLCLGHRVAFTGSDARRHLQDSLRQCDRFRQMVGEWIRKEDGDLERVKQRVKAYEYDGKPGMKQPEPAYLLNLDARVRAIARLG